MMDHSSMDHDMPGMGDGSDDMCEMSMVLNSGYKNLCILSSGWRITTKIQMLSSMAIIVFVTIGYELFKKWAAAFEYRYNSMTESGASSARQLKTFKVKSSIIYGLTVFYSFMIMLLFMTFNVWVMISVTFGAIVGHFLFSDNRTSGQSLACH